MKSAKTKKSVLRKSTEILIVAGLIICAFFGASVRQWLLYGAVGIWGVVNAVYYGRNQVKKWLSKLDDDSDESAPKRAAFHVPNLSEEDPLRKMLRHVNHRITDKVKTCFPGASWDWQVKPNVNFLMNGGVGRIKLMNANPYNFAEVSLDENEVLSFMLIKAVSFEEAVKAETGAKEIVSDYTPDIAAWFENVGGKVIDDVIADVNSHGIRTLHILPGGELAIIADDEQVIKGKVENLPDQSAWAKLVSYLIDVRELGASLQDDRIVLNW